MKPKFTRMIDGIPTMTVTEHEHIVGQLMTIIEEMVQGAEPDCGDPACKDCETWRPAWRAIQELKEKDQPTPLFTVPRQWVGLTDEEVERLAAQVWFGGASAGHERFAKLIEAKLKEKNK